MATHLHPSGLNPLQRFRQATRVLRGTSRATNKAWYQSALEQDFQLHLRTDGTRFEARYYNLKAAAWHTAPAWDDETLRDPGKALALAQDAISRAREAKAAGVGVVLHLADEFATAELKPELDNPGALNDLRRQILDEPDKVLADTSLSPDDYSWRLLPYPAAASESIATAITLGRRHAAFLDTFRKAGVEANFPVATHALSAPLLALLAIPETRNAEDGTRNEDSPSEPSPAAPAGEPIPSSEIRVPRSLLALLPYPRFTILAFFNEHGDLRLLRTLQHRGQRGLANLRHTIATTTAALEMAEPQVFVLPVQPETDPRLLADISALGAPTIAPACAADAPPLEFRMAVASTPPDAPLARSHTFTILREEGWATQDFLPASKDETEIYPTAGEMRLLYSARYSLIGLAAAAVIALAWTGLQFIGMIRQPEWAFKLEDNQALTGRMAVMNAQKAKSEHWDNLLDDRSKAWANMELLARLFPAGGHMMAKSFQYSAKTEAAQAQARAGFVKEWKISGLARDEALEKLANLNTREGIDAVFDEVHRVTGHAAFQTDLPSRSIVVNIRTLENSGFKPLAVIDEFADGDETTYPYTFELTITQRFESADPIAVLAAKAP